MGSFKTTIITSLGHNLMAKLTAGTATMNFTKLKSSSHDYSALTTSQLESLTSLDDIKQEVSVSEVTRINDANVKVTATLLNTELTEGYYINALGLYATDPDIGEILYSVTVAIESDWMPPYNNVSSSSAIYELTTTVSNASNVTIDVDPTAVVSITTFNNFKESVNTQLSESIQNITDLKNNKYTAIRSPLHSYFGYTGALSITQGTNETDLDKSRVGDPFVIWDEDNNCYRMFYWSMSVDGTKFYNLDAIADSPYGVWQKREMNLANDGSTLRLKFTLLVDVYGNPVKINNKYHAYVDGDSSIYHWETDNMNNKWTETGVVLSANFANNGSDTYYCGAPSVIYYNGTIYMFYMASPLVSQLYFGFAIRINRAISSSPSSGFVYDGCACTPSTDSNDWYYGWLGGTQVRLAPDGTYWIALNAGKQRNTVNGAETDSSNWGMAYTDSLRGTWKVLKTPRCNLYIDQHNAISGGQNLLPVPLENGNIWRPFLYYDKSFNRWVAYYNYGNGAEKITYSVENKLKIYNDSNMDITSSEQPILGTKVYLTPGIYNIKFISNVMSPIDGVSTVPNMITNAIKLYKNTELQATTSTYIGQYHYENKNDILEDVIEMREENSYIYLSTQIIDGSSNYTKLRNWKLIIEKIN